LVSPFSLQLDAPVFQLLTRLHHPAIHLEGPRLDDPGIQRLYDTGAGSPRAAAMALVAVAFELRTLPAPPLSVCRSYVIARALGRCAANHHRLDSVTPSLRATARGIQRQASERPAATTGDRRMAPGAKEGHGLAAPADQRGASEDAERREG
jgi:hypothetical protein